MSSNNKILSNQRNAQQGLKKRPRRFSHKNRFWNENRVKGEKFHFYSTIWYKDYWVTCFALQVELVSFNKPWQWQAFAR